MIAKIAKKLQWNFNVLQFSPFLGAHKGLKMHPFTFWWQLCCLHSSALMCPPSTLGAQPGSRPLTPRYSRAPSHMLWGFFLWIYRVFYHSLFSDKNPGRILPTLTEKSKVKNVPPWRLNAGHIDPHANALLTELSQHLIVSLHFYGLYKSCSIDFRHD